MKRFAVLRAKRYSYLTDNNEWKLKFKDYENFSKATCFENEINQLGKNKVDVNSLRENHKEFMESNELILKSQQRFSSERHIPFTEEFNKIALIDSNDKRIKVIDSIEIYAYGTSKDLPSFTKYFRQTLVFMWNFKIWESFNSWFSAAFC